MKVTLKDGFEVHINDAALNDWKLLTALRKIDKGDTGLIVDVAELLLGGEKEVDKLAEHFAVEDGTTPLDVMVDALKEIMESVGELKNS